MKALARVLFAFYGALLFVIPTYSQGVCAGTMATYIQCSGPNNCNQTVPVIEPYFGSASTCLEPVFTPCCSTQVYDYNDSGSPCSDVCDDAIKALLRDQAALEFSLTHTLWVRDCSGRYRPFARLWDGPEKPIDLKSRPALSGIRG